MPPVYMDYQATTPLDPRVVARVRDLNESEEGFGNPHSASHEFGRSAADYVAAARSGVAALIGADDDEIVFTSGATEANNLALLGTCQERLPERDEIIVSAIEHKSVLAAAAHLEEGGFKVRKLRVDADGQIDAGHLRTLLSVRTRIVSVMATNNEIGAEQDIAAISSLCREVGSLLHVDAAQALATSSLNVSGWKADFASFSSHKAYGPKGIGALFVARSARPRIRPVMFGGDQEDGLRPGTLSPPLCVGFGHACDILAAERSIETVRLEALRERFLSKIRVAFPDCELNGSLANRHVGNLNVRFPGIEADRMLALCDRQFAAATGSACTSGIPEPSHVLIALGRSPQEASESIRFSFGRFTTAEDIDATVDALSATAAVRDQLIDR